MAITTATSGEHLLNLVSVRVLASSGQAREIRTAAGLSLADVAGAVGVAAPTVHRWENGLRRPYGEAALRYGALLGALRDHLNDNDLAGNEVEVTTITPGSAAKMSFNLNRDSADDRPASPGPAVARVAIETLRQVASAIEPGLDAVEREQRCRPLRAVIDDLINAAIWNAVPL